LEESYELIYVDPSKCVGCRSCEIACAVEHSLSKNLFLSITERPLPRKRVRVIPADDFTVPMRCMHCEDAPCIAVCPTGAMEKTAEGFVVVNSSEVYRLQDVHDGLPLWAPGVRSLIQDRDKVRSLS
jgi:Fe-S-cluster-containing dehydrogenase component